MKAKTCALIFTAMTLSLGAGNLIAQVFTASDVVNNRAIAASPRAKEAFPWLNRHTPKGSENTPPTAVNKALDKVKRNHALAASPRMIEQFPELAHRPQATHAIAAKSVARPTPATRAIRNRSLTTSPRMRELFPQLARGN